MAIDFPTNPFSTAAIQAGSIAYRFPAAVAGLESAAQLIERLKRTCHGRAAIVGPHGTGKTTLLCTLAESLEQTFERVQWERCIAGDQVSHRIRFDHAQSPRLIVIDGFEQLALWRRWWLRIQTRYHQCGMLVTTHRKPMGLPVLIHTSVSVDLAQTIVRELVKDQMREEYQAYFVKLVPTLLARQQGNLRETLFALYDAYEARRGTE